MWRSSCVCLSTLLNQFDPKPKEWTLFRDVHTHLPTVNVYSLSEKLLVLVGRCFHCWWKIWIWWLISTCWRHLRQRHLRILWQLATMDRFPSTRELFDIDHTHAQPTLHAPWRIYQDTIDMHLIALRFCHINLSMMVLLYASAGLFFNVRGNEISVLR